jgi:hypothetical protein
MEPGKENCDDREDEEEIKGNLPEWARKLRSLLKEGVER